MPIQSSQEQQNRTRWQKEIYLRKVARSKFKDDLDDNALKDRWPKLLKVRMELAGSEASKVLAEIALLCPAKVATLDDIEQICQENDFTMPPPKTYNVSKGSEDLVAIEDKKPRVLKPFEVHIINCEFLKYRDDFLKKRVGQDANMALGHGRIEHHVPSLRTSS